MSRSLINYLLLAALAMLALGSYLSSRDNTPARPTLASLGFTASHSAGIRTAGDEILCLLSENRVQWRSGELKASHQANMTQCRRLVELLALEITPVSTSGDSLEKFGFDKQPRQILFDNGVIKLGGKHPVSNQHYILAHDQLYLTASRINRESSSAPVDFLARKLLPVQTDVVQISTPDYTLKRDHTWSSTPSRDDADELGQKWQHAAAARLSLESPTTVVADKVVFTLHDQQQLSFAILRKSGSEIDLQSLDSALVFTLMNDDFL